MKKIIVAVLVLSSLNAALADVPLICERGVYITPSTIPCIAMTSQQTNAALSIVNDSKNGETIKIGKDSGCIDVYSYARTTDDSCPAGSTKQKYCMSMDPLFKNSVTVDVSALSTPITGITTNVISETCTNGVFQPASKN